MGVEEEVRCDVGGAHHVAHLLGCDQLDLVVVTLKPHLVLLPAALLIWKVQREGGKDINHGKRDEKMRHTAHKKSRASVE